MTFLRRWLASRRILTVFALGALLAAGAPVGADDAHAAAACDPLLQRPSRSVPAEEIEANVQALHAEFSDLPRFVDVYYHAGEAVPYRPLFEDAVPAAALARATRVPVAFDVLAQAPVPLDAGPTPSVDDVRCLGQIRPGAHMTNGCTLSFLYTDGANVYASTAGHCIGPGNNAGVEGIGVVGPAVFSTGSGGVGNDFALIRINDNVLDRVNPEMCFWAGPTRGFTGATITGAVLVHAGHGQFINLQLGLPPRPRAYAGNAWGATSFTWVGGAINGDSGSAIRVGVSANEPAPAPETHQDGAALGVVTHAVGFVVGTPTLGFGTRWDHGLDLAAAAGFADLQLLTVDYVHPI